MVKNQEQFIKDLAKEYVDKFDDPNGLSEHDIQDILEANCLDNILDYPEVYATFRKEVDKLQNNVEEEQSYGYE